MAADVHEHATACLFPAHIAERRGRPPVLGALSDVEGDRRPQHSLSTRALSNRVWAANGGTARPLAPPVAVGGFRHRRRIARVERHGFLDQDVKTSGQQRQGRRGVVAAGVQ